jgi:hypothetical protein
MFAGLEQAPGGGDEAGVVEAERVADQHARVEIGRIEPGRAECPRELAAQRRDRDGCGERGHRPESSAASNAA